MLWLGLTKRQEKRYRERRENKERKSRDEKGKCVKS
jgi:hypothetical protein